MSTWVTHFIHDRNPDNDPDMLFGEGGAIRFPYTYDHEKNERFADWHYSDTMYPIAPDGTALQVLWKIIADGHIRSTWSFRNGRATIYGPRSAVCFTEMPLYALVQYAQQRADKYNVQPYGISLLKRELFRVGARPVIYGLTRIHSEVPDKLNQPAGAITGWPRFLNRECGLAEHEQYRYVNFNLGDGRYSDWTHEREWRWCDSEDQCSCPGLPLYLKDAFSFSTILMFVPTVQEAGRVLDRLRVQYDVGYDDRDEELHRTNLLNTRVIALDQMPKEGLVRLEDIPMQHLAVIQLPIPTDELIDRVRQALVEAQAAAQAGADAAHREARKNKDGHILDVSGFASLMISEPQSELTAALLKLKAIEPGVKRGRK